jgi:hypothetical protein
MANGWSCKASDVQPGDLLMGDDGSPRRVVQNITCRNVTKLHQVQFKRHVNDLYLSSDYLLPYRNSFVPVLSRNASRPGIRVEHRSDTGYTVRAKNSATHVYYYALPLPPPPPPPGTRQLGRPQFFRCESEVDALTRAKRYCIDLIMERCLEDDAIVDPLTRGFHYFTQSATRGYRVSYRDPNSNRYVRRQFTVQQVRYYQTYEEVFKLQQISYNKNKDLHHVVQY